MNLIYLSLTLERKPGIFLPWEMEEFESCVTVMIEELRWVGMTKGIVKYLSLGLKSLWGLWYPSVIKKCCRSE